MITSAQVLKETKGGRQNTGDRTYLISFSPGFLALDFDRCSTYQYLII